MRQSGPEVSDDNQFATWQCMQELQPSIRGEAWAQHAVAANAMKASRERSAASACWATTPPSIDMPTGYTANVPDGITFEQFVWQCARGMGALVMMRDEPTGAPIPERFEPSDYNAKRLQEATDELARLRSLTPEQMQAECEAKHAKSEAQKKKRLAENEAQLAAYRAMLDQVLAWVPPTKDQAKK